MTNPTPEAINAAFTSIPEDEMLSRKTLTTALTAALPFIAAQAKGEALEQIAVEFEALASTASYSGTEDTMETWLAAARHAWARRSTSRLG